MLSEAKHLSAPEHRQHFRRCALTRLYRAIHVAIPHRRRLSSRPVQAAKRGAQCLSVARPGSGRHIASVAPARVFLLGPVLLDILAWPAPLLTKVTCKALEHSSSALACTPATPPSSLVSLDESEQYAWRTAL